MNFVSRTCGASSSIRGPGYKQNLAAAVGLTGVSDAAFPAFTIPGYATLGNPAAVFRFQTPILDRQFLDSLSWSKGRHALKFGAEYRAGANDEIRDRSSAGNFYDQPADHELARVWPTPETRSQVFCSGEVNCGSVQVSDKIRTRASYWAFYVQDDWRVTGDSTLNYGFAMGG